MKKFVFFSAKSIFLKHSLDTRNTIMTSFANISRKFVFFLSSKSEKTKKNLHFLANWIFFRVFCGHKKCSFGFSAEIVSLKTELLFGSKWKTNRSNVSYSRKTVFNEIVIRTRTKQFWHFWRHSFCCNQFFFCSNSKNGQNCMLFSKTIFPQSVCWTKKALLKTLPKFSILESSFWSKPEKDGKNSKKWFSIRKLLRTQGKKFWIPGG